MLYFRAILFIWLTFSAASLCAQEYPGGQLIAQGKQDRATTHRIVNYFFLFLRRIFW